MRCCKKRGIIYTDGGKAPVMREPSLEIIGMLVGSIACCPNVEHLVQFSRNPGVFRDLTTIDLLTTPLAMNSRGTASPALCSRMPTGTDNLVDQQPDPDNRSSRRSNSGAVIGAACSVRVVARTST